MSIGFHIQSTHSKLNALTNKLHQELTKDFKDSEEEALNDSSSNYFIKGCTALNKEMWKLEVWELAREPKREH